ncbi:MAG: STAS domain-containing protein [Burkholderiales bacterium]|jgi:anti-anti-sigma factor|nr:STAS domain-containing protein [Burkholderiales bacterium]
MDLHEERLDQVTALSVKGRIDSTTAAQFGQKLEAVVADPSGRLVVDFRDLDYISSAGFRVLLVAAKRADQSGSRLVLCGLSSKVRQLFDVGGFLDLFSITATRDEAIAATR